MWPEHVSMRTTFAVTDLRLIFLIWIILNSEVFKTSDWPLKVGVELNTEPYEVQ